MKKTFLILVFIFSSLTHAGFLVEPYLGYEHGLSSDTDLSFSTTTYDFESEPGSGLKYGGRLGYSLPMGVFFAFDYSMASFSVEDKITASNGVQVQGLAYGETDVDQKAMGVTVGLGLPIIRLWATYIFNANWEMTSDKVLNTDPAYESELSGSGFNLGLSYALMPMFNIFVEYSNITVDEIEKFTSNGVDLEAALGAKYERSRSSILIGVNFPFDLI